MEQSIVVYIDTQNDIAVGRKTAKETAQALQFPTVDQTRLVTVVSELARNIYKYAKKGYIKLEILEHNQRNGVRITATDQGPGIHDVQKALVSGYSTSGSLGAGIPGVKKMMDEFAISAPAGIGTTVTAVKWR